MNSNTDNFDLCFDTNTKAGISAIIACMNREDNLILCVKECLEIDDITEIIVIDYGSSTPIRNLPPSNRIKLYRVESPYWHLSKAYNMAAQLVSNNILIKLDSDYLLDKNFIKYNHIEPNEYISGIDRTDSLSGFLMIYKKDFLYIGGYNENIINYGYDDDDINKRLAKLEYLKRKNLNREFIKHLFHAKKPSEWFKNNAFGLSNRNDMIYKNQKISNESYWGKNSEITSIYNFKLDVSAIVCCMNRNENLLKSLYSWIDTKYLKEIIILDYGCSIPLISQIPKDLLNSSVVKLYRQEAKNWHLTKAYNIVAQLASNPILVKLDSDYYLDKDFFEANVLHNDREFITGNGTSKQCLWGFLMCMKKHFMSVNGYNERIIGWGHDDIDINKRLIKQLGLKNRILNTKFITHLPHSQDKNTNVHNDLSINESREKNIYTMISEPWTEVDTMSVLNNTSQGR